MKTITSLSLLMLLTLQPACRHTPPPITPLRSAAPNIPISLPPGATLALRTAQEIDSSSSSPGQTFAAVVSRNIDDVTGQTALTSGSPAKLMLLRVHQTSAKGELFELLLASVTLNGDSYLVRNESQAANSALPGARLGTFLGGVPGTEHFPAARQLTVSGERIWVPEGSLLTFRLDRPVLLIGSH
jgi:hypothetical protein